jgi:hypothetical protein
MRLQLEYKLYVFYLDLHMSTCGNAAIKFEKYYKIYL